MWRGPNCRVIPEAAFPLSCVTGFDVRQEDRFALRVMYTNGLWEVKLNNTLKFPEESFLDEILGFVVLGIAINKAFVLW